MNSDEELRHRLAHRALRWNSPLSDLHADRLLAALELATAVQLVDLGCGWGELLLRALTRAPQLTGEGVDGNSMHIERARSSAVARGLSDRASFLIGDLLAYPRTADRVICIGADHAWGGVEGALSGLESKVSPGGLLLFGCGYWGRPPSAKFAELFGALPPSHESLVAQARSQGWAVLSSDSADRAEWDEFETSWRRDLEELAAREPSTALGQQALRLARQRREEYEYGYRDRLEFAYLVLGRPDPTSTEALRAGAP